MRQAARQPDDDRTAGFLSPETRARLIEAGVEFPDETRDERRLRIKRAFDLLDDEDLGALLGIGETALARLRLDGTGPAPTVLAKSVFYRRCDVDEWLNVNRREPGYGRLKPGPMEGA